MQAVDIPLDSLRDDRSELHVLLGVLRRGAGRDWREVRRARCRRVRRVGAALPLTVVLTVSRAGLRHHLAGPHQVGIDVLVAAGGKCREHLLDRGRPWHSQTL